MRVIRKVKTALICGAAALLVPDIVVASSMPVMAQETAEYDKNVLTDTRSQEVTAQDDGSGIIVKPESDTGKSAEETTGETVTQKAYGTKEDPALSEGSDRETKTELQSDSKTDSKTENVLPAEENKKDTDSKLEAKVTEEVRDRTVFMAKPAATGEVKSITFDKTAVKPGDTVTVTLELNPKVVLTDGSKIDVVIKNKDNDIYVKYVNLAKNTDGKYVGKFRVRNDMLNGKWSVSEIREYLGWDDSGDSLFNYLSVSGITLPYVTVSGSPEDHTGPEVKSVKFDKKEYKAGETVTVTVEANEVSGFDSGLYANYLAITNGNEYHEIYLKKQSDNKLKGTIKTDDKWLNGDYSIVSLVMTDALDNTTSYNSYYDEKLPATAKASFKLTSSKEDKTGPVTESACFMKTNAKPGEEVTLVVKANDPGGIYSSEKSDGHGTWHIAGSVTIGIEQSGDGDNKTSKETYLRLQPDGTMIAAFTVDDTWSNGTYNVLELTVYDELENRTVYSKDDDLYWDWEADIVNVKTNTLTVSGSKTDMEPPVVSAVYFNKVNVRPGDNITVTADVSDATGYDSVYVELLSDSKEIYSSKDVRLHKDVNGKFKGTLEIDDTWENGKYSVTDVRSVDVLGNSDRYSWEKQDISKVKTQKLTVSGSKEDREGPKVENILFDKKTVKPNDTVKVTATVTEQSEVKEISVSVVNEKTKDNNVIPWTLGDGTDYSKKKTVVLRPDENGNITGEFKIDASWENGKYVIGKYEAYDVLNNMSNEMNNHLYDWNEGVVLFDSSFTVSGAGTDTQGPIIKSITTDKSTVSPGDEFNITLELEDENGVDDYIPVMQMSTMDNYSWIWHGAFGDGCINGIYIIPVVLDNAITNGVYYLSELMLRDKLGNVTYYANDMKKAEQGGYTYLGRQSEYSFNADNEVSLAQKDIIKINVVNSTETFSGPEILSLALDKKKVKQGESLSLVAGVKNPENVDYVLVVMKKDSNLKSDSKYASLTLNDDGKIKSELEIGTDWEPGVYRIESLYVIDKDNNRYEVGVDKTNTDKKVEDIIIGSDRFEVVKNDISISLDKKLLVMDKGKSGKLTATVNPKEVTNKTVTWSSSDDSVATVDPSGNVKAVSSGKTVITAKNAYGKTATCEVRVNFADVTNNKQYYYKPVYWAAENKITTGSNGLFAPHNSCTREHAITFLWRMAGGPQPKSMVSKFKDVTNKNSYSYKAIMWGMEKGIITGAGGIFAPGNTCTREQIVTMLWRLAGKPAPKSTNVKFSDMTDKNRYSYKAVLWAGEKGITTGQNGKFAPAKTCTRAEIVTFIYRYKNTVK